MRLHRGITMHKIPVEGDAGFLFAVGIIVLALTSLPQARWFLALSLPTGIVIGIILRLTSRD
jgi:hypothetical protein